MANEQTAEASVQLHPISGKRQVEAIPASEPLKISYSGADNKWQILMRVGNREVPMIKREVFIEEFARNWKLFHDTGLPVVPTLRLDKENDIIYMTDLTADGSEFYGKGQENRIALQEYDSSIIPEGRNTVLDAVFVSTYQKNIDPLTREVERIASEATQKGILLPHDDPFDLLIHPDGSYQLYILDLALGGHLEDFSEPEFLPREEIAQVLQIEIHQVTLDMMKELSKEEKHQIIETVNDQSAQYFLGILSDIYEKLSS